MSELHNGENPHYLPYKIRTAGDMFLISRETPGRSFAGCSASIASVMRIRWPDEAPTKAALWRFSDRLKMLYSDWNEHKGRQWRDAEHIVIRTPEKFTHDLDDSSLFFYWLFGYMSEDVYLVLSRDQICCVCACKHSWKQEITLEASFCHYFAKEAKRLVDADFVIKDKSSGWKLEHALKKFLAEYRESTGNRKKSRVGDHVQTVKRKKYGASDDGFRKKLVVGFIGEWVTEEVQGIEFREVTDAFFRLAKIK